MIGGGGGGAAAAGGAAAGGGGGLVVVAAAGLGPRPLSKDRRIFVKIRNQSWRIW